MSSSTGVGSRDFYFSKDYDQHLNIRYLTEIATDVSVSWLVEVWNMDRSLRVQVHLGAAGTFNRKKVVT